MSTKESIAKRGKIVSSLRVVNLDNVEEDLVRFYKLRLEVKLPIDAVLLVGGIGIGKTETVIRVAKKIASLLNRKYVEWNGSQKQVEELLSNPDKYFLFIDFPSSTIDAIDLSGALRDIPELQAVDYKVPLYLKILNKIGYGMIFFDEFNNEKDRQLFSALLKATLEKRFGWIKLSRGIFIIGACNPPEVSMLATDLDTRQLDRFILLDVRPFSIENWIQYMNKTYGTRWDKRIAGFLLKNPALYYNPPSDVSGMENFPTPRSWSTVAILMYHNYPISWITGLIGENASGMLKAFLDNKIIPLSELDKNPELWDTLNLDSKWLTLTYQIDNLIEVWNKDSKAYSRFLQYIFYEQRDEEIIQVLLNLIPVEHYKTILDILEDGAKTEHRKKLLEQWFNKIRILT